MVSSRSLEVILAEIRETTLPHPDEGYEAFMKRTYHMGIVRWQNELPELPNVKAVQERSKQASRRAGKPEKPKEDE